MSEYLLPSDTGLSIADKRNIFEIRNRMVNISSNFPKNQKQENCVCGKTENMEHIYTCELLNSDNTTILYNHIYKGTLAQHSV